jgi:beta-lactamase regulating signal transducer with metallopeptidase domain
MGLGLHGQALAQIFAERMLNSVVEGVAIALFGWIVLRALGRQSMGRQNASTRFAVRFLALVAVAGLPLFENITATSPASVAGGSHFALHLPASWAFNMFVVWALVAAGGLVRIVFGLWQVHKLRQGCTVIPPTSLDASLRNTLEEFGCPRRVTLCTSTQVRVPTAIGFVKPAVIFPAWALKELSPLELNAVLLHELAHLRRWDDWTNLAQRILRALFFFHPAVWWIGRGLAIEREMACDDFVLAATSNPRAYAQCLVSVAEKTFLRRGLALAQAVVGRIQHTAERVSRILEADRLGASRIRIKIWKPALALVAAFSAVCLISLPRAPKLVAFEQSLPSQSATFKAAPVLADDSAGAEAKVIPAAFHIPVSSAAQPSPTQSVSPRPRNNGNNSSHRVVKLGPAAPQVLRTSAAGSGNNSAGMESVVLVLQTGQLDDSGQMVWNIQVWHLTVFHPVDRQVQKGSIPKST